MITRVARNDVVRLTRTGEVGTVKGWADHERLAQHGTIIEIELSKDRAVQASGRELEFVADAKLNPSKGKAVWIFVAMLLAVMLGGMTGTHLVLTYGVTWYGAFGCGVGMMAITWRTLYLFTIRPRKTRVNLPAQYVTKPGTRGVSQPVNKG